MLKDAKPVIHAPRRIAPALHDRLKEKLASMERKGIIAKVDKPTNWVISMQVVEKKDRSLRLCLEPGTLNEAIK